MKRNDGVGPILEPSTLTDDLLLAIKAYVNQEVQVALAERLGREVSAGSRTPSPRLSALIDAFIEEKSRTTPEHRGYSGQTRAQAKVTFRLWLELIGDRSVGEYLREDAGKFRSSLLRMPAAHGKARKLRRAAKEIKIAENSKRDVPRLTMKTVKRHFSTMSQLWTYSKQFGYVQENIFSGFSFPGTRSSRKLRDDWSSQQLEILFRSERWSETSDRNSAEWWIPLIALHSGMRLEEICRLRPADDIQELEGIPCFVIQEQGDWSPKSDAGVRIVPIHNHLLELGLMALVDARKSEGRKRLFPELRPSGPDRKLGNTFSREFSKYKVGLGISSRRVVFHSFRHTFRTVLESTDAKSSWIDAVMGHESDGGQGMTYTKRVSVQRLNEVVQAFVSPFDLSAPFFEK
jgi:integrase